MEQQNNENYLDILLHYAIKHPDKIHDIYFLKTLIKDADFIIFYYIEALQKEHATLSLPNLQACMGAHKLNWINPKSIFMQQAHAPEISKAYISSMTNESLSTRMDYANILEKAVLDRFKEITSTRLIDDNEFSVIREKAVDTANVLLAKDMYSKLIPLLEGAVPYIIFNKVRYTLRDVLAYLQANLSFFIRMMTPSEIEDYSTNIVKTLANSIQAMTPTFAFNLGKSIFTNPQAGFLVSVVAAEKLGKTRFVLGEMVLPTLLLGKNVLYLSGEMQPIQILSILLVKFMYLKGKIIPEDVVTKFLVCLNRIREDVATPAQLDYFNKISDDIKETIILAENELFYSGKYGKIIIKHISDNLSVNGKSKYFNLEEYFPLIRSELDSMPEEERYAMIVRDHINHVSSLNESTPVQTVTTYLQEAKTLATDKQHPLVYVAINHITTELAKKIEEQGNVDGLKLRGHNSNEEGKTADLQLFLYERTGQRKEGLVTVVVENDRFCDVEHMFKTKEFIMETRREVSDFNFFGEHKMAYPVTAEEFDDFLNKNTRG